MDEQISKRVETFFSSFKPQKFKKGEILIRADEDPTGIYFLREGLVKEYVISQKGEEVVVNIFKPNSYFPMSWAFSKTPNSYYFEAISDVVTWKAPVEKVLSFLQKEPTIVFDLLKRVYRGTDGLITRMTYLMAGSAYTRLISELLIQVKRFGENRDDQVQLHISEKDLAAYSGMTRETVSRELKLLKGKKLVTFSKNIMTIPNLHLLESELRHGV